MTYKLVLHLFAAANVALLAICAYSFDSDIPAVHPAGRIVLGASIHSGAIRNNLIAFESEGR